MEESLARLERVFGLESIDMRRCSPLTLAYVGDAVYELIVRTILVRRDNCPVNLLNKKASSLVKAAAQSAAMAVLEPQLTEEEASVYRRGRNAHPSTKAKNATVGDYRRATGFEALVGYLYLKKEEERLLELVSLGIRSLETGEVYE